MRDVGGVAGVRAAVVQAAGAELPKNARVVGRGEFGVDVGSEPGRDVVADVPLPPLGVPHILEIGGGDVLLAACRRDAGPDRGAVEVLNLVEQGVDRVRLVVEGQHQFSHTEQVGGDVHAAGGVEQRHRDEPLARLGEAADATQSRRDPSVPVRVRHRQRGDLIGQFVRGQDLALDPRRLVRVVAPVVLRSERAGQARTAHVGPHRRDTVARRRVLPGRQRIGQRRLELLVAVAELLPHRVRRRYGHAHVDGDPFEWLAGEQAAVEVFAASELVTHPRLDVQGHETSSLCSAETDRPARRRSGQCHRQDQRAVRARAADDRLPVHLL